MAEWEKKIGAINLIVEGGYTWDITQELPSAPGSSQGGPPVSACDPEITATHATE